MSDGPDKASKFLGGQTLVYTKGIRAVGGFKAQLNSYTEVDIESLLAPKARRNRTYPAFHAGLRRCDGCEKASTKQLIRAPLKLLIPPGHSYPK